MKGFENGNIIAEFSQIAGAGNARRAGADNSDFFAIQFFGAFGSNAVFHSPVGHKAFKLADGHRFTFDTKDADAFALGFLGAHTAANRGKRGRFGNGLVSFFKFTFSDMADKFGDIDTHRASADTAGFFTTEAAGRFEHRFFFVITVAYFFKIGGPYFGFLFSDGHSWNFVCHYLSPPHSPHPP